MYMSVETITIIIAAATLVVTIVAGLFAFSSWILRQLDARFAQADARVDAGFDKVDERFAQVDARVDARFDKVDERFAQVDARIDERFDKVDAQFTQVDARFSQVDETLAARLAVVPRKVVNSRGRKKTSGIDGVTTTSILRTGGLRVPP